MLAGLALEVFLIWAPGGKLLALTKVAETAANLMVVLGVWAEVAFGNAGSKVQTEQVARSNVMLVEAFEKASEAGEHAAELEKEAAGARAEAARALLAIEQLRLPRAITPEQNKIIVDGMKNAPVGPVYMRPANFDPESTTYSSQLEATLKEAGVDVQKWPGQGSVSWRESGVFLIVREIANPPAHAGFLQQVLKSAGIDATGYQDPNHPEGVSIGVGAKV